MCTESYRGGLKLIKMLIKPGDLLSRIDTPDELRKLSQDQLVRLSQELRQYIIDSVSVYGGHFGVCLGVVELTVALHYVYITPSDQLILDVGHQEFAHTILNCIRYDYHNTHMHTGIS